MAQPYDSESNPSIGENLVAKHFGQRPPAVRMKWGATSHTGKIRRNNEDHFVAIERRRTQEVLRTNLPLECLPSADDVAYLFAVADGLGGAAFGELASRLALCSGWEQASNAVKWTWIINEREIEDLRERVGLIFGRMDDAVRRRAEEDPKYAGMGTTLTAAYTVGPETFIAHVGDSRAYLCRQGKLTQLTSDHTLAQECIDSGTPILSSSWHHALTNCLGGRGEEIYIEFHHLQLADGDQLLLCTDGLTTMVSDPEIASILEQQHSPQEKVDMLIALALNHGGRDNVTVVLAQYALLETA